MIASPIQTPARDDAARLRHSFRQARQRQRLLALALIGPLVAFLLVTFIAPIAMMLFHAINNPEIRSSFPATLQALETWDGQALPSDQVARSFVVELAGAERPALANAARRLNYEVTGARSALMKTARSFPSGQLEGGMAALVASDAIWGQVSSWAALKRAGSRFTPYYLLAAVDLRQTDDGSIARAAPMDRLFLDTLIRTLVISGIVTGLCLLLGFPIAQLIVSGGPRLGGLMLACVLLPFWTSLLVRTSAWIVILQKEGLINSLLLHLGLIAAPLELVFNRTGLYIAMTHILLPFMVMPLVSVMKGLPPSYMRAAASLGATPWTAFRRVYLPLVLPGLGSGCLLTFIIAAGYYVTPTLVGGASDQMLSYFVAFYTNTTLNWGMAAALGLVLLAGIFLLYLGLGRLIGIGRLVGME